MRERRDAARKLLAQDIDPGEKKKEQKRERIARAGNTFEATAREFLAKRTKWAKSHKDRVERMLERDIFPKVGRRPIVELQATEVLAAMRPIEERAPDTANRALGIIGQIFRYGVAAHRCLSDPTVNLRGALERPEAGHFATTLDPEKLGSILRAFDGYYGTTTVRCALRLAPLVFCEAR
jgi:integrase